MGDIFSVEPPKWLQEISTADVMKPQRESYALGLQAAHQRDQAQLMGLRVQAQMLQSEARIQALQSANATAAMRMQIAQGQMSLAQERLEAMKTVTAQKVSDVKGFHAGWNTLSAPDRQSLDEMNPEWLNTGPNTAQWNVLNDKLQAKKAADEEALKAQGMVATSSKVGAKGVETTYKNVASQAWEEHTDPVSGARYGGWVGGRHFDLSAIPPAKNFKIRSAQKDLDEANKALSGVPTTSSRYNALFSDRQAAQSAFDSLLAPYEKTPAPAPVAPVTPSASKMIRVKSKDGITGQIPADQLEEAKKQGYTPLE